MLRKKNKVELSTKLKLGVGRGYSKSQLFKYSGILFLVISAGLALNTFRLISSENKSTEVSGTVLGAQDEVQFMEYKVAKDDTLFNIAQKFHIEWTTLVTLNNLNPAVKLKIGQVLKVPKQ